MRHKSLDEIINQTAKIIDNRINHIFLNKPQSDLLSAMKYSSISKGKKIRPLIIFISASSLGIAPRKMLDIAVAIELIHTYSLIHDDLPSMDDDDIRRQKPSCHKKFGEATAILAGDALLTFAFEIISENKVNFSYKIKCQMLNAIAKSIGFMGMAGGQDLDLKFQNNQISLDKLLEIQKLKTGKLFELCIELAIIASEKNDQNCQILREYIKNFGLIFQIKDDIEDFNNNPENLSEMNIVKIIGIKKTQQKLIEFKNNASKIFKQNISRNLFIELLKIF